MNLEEFEIKSKDAVAEALKKVEITQFLLTQILSQINSMHTEIKHLRELLEEMKNCQEIKK